MSDMGFDTTTWTQDSKSKATNDVTTTTSQTLSGTLTAGYVKLSNNVLQASDGGNTITLDDDDNVGVAGKLKVTSYFAANNKTPAVAPSYTTSTQSARNANTATTTSALQDVIQTLCKDLIDIGILKPAGGG